MIRQVRHGPPPPSRPPPFRPPPSAREPRPLPPVPLLFSNAVVGSNIRVLGRGERAEWSPQLEVGVCGLDRPLGKGDTVRLGVEGTGYFYVVVRTKPMPVPSLVKKSKERANGTEAEPSDIIEEVKFKLKRSQFLIEVRKLSRTMMHVLAVPSGTKGPKPSTTKHDVLLPHGLDSWVTFNILFGDLRLTLEGSGGGKIEKPWSFGPQHGLNIKQRSKQEIRSLHPNPCAIAVTERPITPGETIELRVLPNDINSQMEVIVYLTNKEPHLLKLHNPNVYFHNGKKDVYSFLTEMYTIKKFQGRLLLKVDAKKDCLEIEEKPEDSAGNSSDGGKGTSVRSIRLWQSGLDRRRPLYVCVALLRATVTIVQRGAGDSLYAQPGYACFVPGQTVTKVSEYMSLLDDAYLTPIPDSGPPSYPAPAPPPPSCSRSPSRHPPAPPPLTPAHPLMTSEYLNPTSRMPCAPPSVSSPHLSPRPHLAGRADQPERGTRWCSPPTPLAGPERVTGPSGAGPSGVGPLPGPLSGPRECEEEKGPYMSMDGYILPSSSTRAVPNRYVFDGPAASCSQPSASVSTASTTTVPAYNANRSVAYVHGSSPLTGASTTPSGSRSRFYTNGSTFSTNVCSSSAKESAPCTSMSARAGDAAFPFTGASAKSGSSASLDPDPLYLTAIPNPWEVTPCSNALPLPLCSRADGYEAEEGASSERRTLKNSASVMTEREGVGSASDGMLQPSQASSQGPVTVGGSCMKIEPSPVVYISAKSSSENSASLVESPSFRISNPSGLCNPNPAGLGNPNPAGPGNPNPAGLGSLPKFSSSPTLRNYHGPSGFSGTEEVSNPAGSFHSMKCSGSTGCLVSDDTRRLGRSCTPDGSVSNVDPVGPTSSPLKSAFGSIPTSNTALAVTSPLMERSSAVSVFPADQSGLTSRSQPLTTTAHYQNVPNGPPEGSQLSPGATLHVMSTHGVTVQASHSGEPDHVGFWQGDQEGSFCGDSLNPCGRSEEQAAGHPSIVFANEMVQGTEVYDDDEHWRM